MKGNDCLKEFLPNTNDLIPEEIVWIFPLCLLFSICFDWFGLVMCVSPLFCEVASCLPVPRVMAPLRCLQTNGVCRCGWLRGLHITSSTRKHYVKVSFKISWIKSGSTPLGWSSSRTPCQTCVETWSASSPMPEYLKIPACFSMSEYLCIVFWLQGPISGGLGAGHYTGDI